MSKVNKLSKIIGTIGKVQSFAVWAGNQQALDQLVMAQNQLQSTEVMSQILAFFDDDDDDEGGEGGSGFQRYQITGDGTAVLPLKGAFVNYDLPAFIESYFGIRGYAGMQRDFATLAQDERVKRVVLDVDSGGGHVSGIYETTRSLEALRQVKPVASYTSDAMYSAAYWVGSNTDMVGMSPMAGVGSIGVVMTHIDVTKSMEDAGIKATVIRSRPNKALGGAYETLSPEARASLDREIQFYHSKFVNHVSKNRKISVDTLESGVSDGSTFLGVEGKTVGLADSVTDFDNFVAQFEAATPQTTVDNPVQFNHTPNPIGALNMNLEEALAKIAEKEAEAKVAADEKAELAAELRASKVAQKALATQVEALEAQVDEAATLKESHSKILAASITGMCNALNAKVILPESLEDLSAMHEKVSGEFQAAFPNGRVSASTAEDNSKHGSDPEAAHEPWYNRLKASVGK